MATGRCSKLLASQCPRGSLGLSGDNWALGFGVGRGVFGAADYRLILALAVSHLGAQWWMQWGSWDGWWYLFWGASGYGFGVYRLD